MKNYGLVLSKEKDPNAFVLGGFASLPKVIIRPDGQWDAFLPDREIQNEGYEKYNCTGYNTNACLEILFNALNTGIGDRSDRWLGIKAGTKPPGNDPHVVAQAARKSGVISESSLPNSGASTIDEYYTFKGTTEDVCDFEAQDFLKKWAIGHEYVWDGKISTEERKNRIKEALQYSPLGISVSAWYLKDGVYVDNGQPNNHWTCAYGYTDKGIKVFDSYDNDLKIVSWEHNSQVCKRYHLEKQATSEEINIFLQILKKLLEWAGIIEKQQNATITSPTINSAPSPSQSVTEAISIPKYDWDTPILARHSVRVIADEEGLNVEQKDTMCATIGAESGWKQRVIGAVKLGKRVLGGINRDGTRDYGICQINTKYWIGPGKQFPSIEYVLENPEACVRWMCKQWKLGHRNWWVAYRNGSYKKFL